ncbi:MULTISPECIES: hypothetical protein [unclassified Moorena]|uniref:hypothetical protein n=1 Tax=unclassified Moorena TaxID=2683338 RepID=UPI0013B84B64|nr:MULTISPECIES: hypothetical protein [unclassified Moorena]NEQ15114.1 hypothetical protein [Moorena sp. SIO3E2]NEP34319.1 hypothetical protein [Moorena sp. SIO3B2]NEP70219.1 hypothetical protein [Moorena sp. SIO3A5]NER92171.1 hypothetical protein [Moorena sp. SIO3A2]NET63809.1 hypothetical protein [Moorena sp. SIO1G6]
MVSVVSVVSVPPLLRGVRGDLQLGFSWEISDRIINTVVRYGQQPNREQAENQG